MSATDNDIREALSCLDPENDEHWTQSGLPSLKAISAVCGETVARGRVEAIAPNFTRSNQEIPPPSAVAPTSSEAFPAKSDPEAPAKLEEALEEYVAVVGERAAVEAIQTIADEALGAKVARLEKENQDLRDALARASDRIRKLDDELKVNGRSPIDRAFKARRGFGMSRPKVPLVRPVGAVD